MAGIGQKIKDVAHKVTHPGEHRRHEETTGVAGGTTEPLGTGYANVGATYGAAGTSGIAGPVAPASAGYEGEAGVPAAGYREGYAEGGTATETRAGYAEVPVVQQTTTAAMPGEAVVAQGAPQTCAQETFTKVEDRPVVKERVEQVMEHRPVEQEFVVETRQTGAERAVGGGEVEHLGTTERVVGMPGAERVVGAPGATMPRE